MGLAFRPEKAAIDALIKGLKDNDNLVTQQCVRSLMQMGEPALKAVIDNSKNIDIMLASEILSHMAGDVVPSLLVALSTPDKDKRTAVIFALKDIGDKRAVEPLRKALKAEKSDSLRMLIDDTIKEISAK